MLSAESCVPRAVKKMGIDGKNMRNRMNRSHSSHHSHDSHFPEALKSEDPFAADPSPSSTASAQPAAPAVPAVQDDARTRSDSALRTQDSVSHAVHIRS